MGFMITADLYRYRIAYGVFFGSQVFYRLTGTGIGVTDVIATVRCKKNLEALVGEGVHERSGNIGNPAIPA